MLNFKKIEISDKDIITEFTSKYGGNSCENSFITLLIWADLYNNKYAISEGQLIIKSENAYGSTYRLPLGDDLEKGIYLIKKNSGEDFPEFWAEESERFNNFCKLYGNFYNIKEERNAADYIYLRDDLANLCGKKYHSKRNHISAFSRKFDWHFEEISNNNIKKIEECSENWYLENNEIIDKYLVNEKNGLSKLLNNFEKLNLMGGGIFVDGKAVAFSIASKINEKYADVHYEKSLRNFAEGYSVINNEMAKHILTEFEFLNREDDMGLEGLRKAKLSYKPYNLITKYSCRKRINIWTNWNVD